LLRGQTNGDHNALEVLHHVFVGESEHAVSTRSKPFIASRVVTKARFEIVALTVYFNDELAGMRDEIRDVIPHRALSAKTDPGEPVCLQMAPQEGFGASHRAS
jgi:hypothetical protein